MRERESQSRFSNCTKTAYGMVQIMPLEEVFGCTIKVFRFEFFFFKAFSTKQLSDVPYQRSISTTYQSNKCIRLYLMAEGFCPA